MVNIFIVIFFSLCVHSAQALMVGSNSAFSVQAATTFPPSVGNEMLGFAAFPAGFTLTNNSTTCTFDSFFPISGNVDMGGGTLYLLQDLVISNSIIVKNTGSFFGFGRSIEFGKYIGDYPLPASSFDFSLLITASQKMSGDGVGASTAVDWSMNNKYIAAGSSTSATKQDLRIYFFNGTTLTTTQAVEIPTNINGLAWNTKSNYLATAHEVATNNIQVRLLNVSNGRLTLSSEITASASDGGANSVDWHQSGNYLGVGASSAKNTAISVYSFSQTTGVLSATPISAAIIGQLVYAVSWGPGGNYITGGTTVNAGAGAPELYVCAFNGSSLTITASAAIGATIQSVDWAQTGTYIAVGAAGLSNNLLIYNFQSATGTLQQVQSANTNESIAVHSVAWDRTGQYLYVGLDAGAVSAFRLYYFNPVTLTLTLVGFLPSGSNVEGVRWSHNNAFAAYETTATDVVVTSTQALDQNFLFYNMGLVMNSNIDLTSPCYFHGNCKINGRGKTLVLGVGEQTLGQLILRPGANLILEDLQVEGVYDNNIRCMTDQASLTLRNSILTLSSQYTFSRGSMFFDEEVMITGTNAFNYTTGLGSTIASQATLFLDSGVTFSYQPRRALSNLINMTDNTSQLYLNGCTLHSTRTGLTLSTGMIIVDQAVTFTSEARSLSEAMRLSSSLSAYVRGNASMNFNGLIRYD